MVPTLLTLALLAAPPTYDVPTFNQCLDRLDRLADAEGVNEALFDLHVRSVTPDTSVLRLLDAQPEFETPIWDYLAGLVDDERVADGEAMLQRHAATLARVEAGYGVDRATLVAVWGVESDFGQNFGNRPLLQSLTTLSCMGRRQEFFRGELVATLQIIQAGHVTADKLVGS